MISTEINIKNIKYEANMTIEGNVLSKTEFSTVITTKNRRYTINESPSKGIELLIEPISKEPDEHTVRLWMPVGTKTLSPNQTVEGGKEISIYPVPKKVLEDIQERTNRYVEVEDVAQFFEETKPEQEFFIRIHGQIILATV